MGLLDPHGLASLYILSTQLATTSLHYIIALSLDTRLSVIFMHILFQKLWSSW